MIAQPSVSMVDDITPLSASCCLCSPFLVSFSVGFLSQRWNVSSGKWGVAGFGERSRDAALCPTELTPEASSRMDNSKHVIGQALCAPGFHPPQSTRTSSVRRRLRWRHVEANESYDTTHCFGINVLRLAKYQHSGSLPKWDA